MIAQNFRLITEEEIARLDKFDVDGLLEATRQVELSMADSIRTKESLDKKTISLLAIYISLSTILFGLSEKITHINFSLPPYFYSPSYSVYYWWNTLNGFFKKRRLWCYGYIPCCMAE